MLIFVDGTVPNGATTDVLSMKKAAAKELPPVAGKPVKFLPVEKDMTWRTPADGAETVRPGCSAPVGPDVVTSFKHFNLNTATRENLLAYFENSWYLYETLFRSLRDDSTYYLIPDRLRRPLIFYLAHTAALYANKLVLAKVLPERINPHFERLFETGVDEMSWDDMDVNKYAWPSVKDAWDYRKQVYHAVKYAIETCSYKLPITQDDPLWALVMGFEHERIHLETSAVLIRQLPIEHVIRPPAWVYGPTCTENGSYPKNEMVSVPEGTVEVGKPRDFPSYGWDNEYGKKVAKVAPFKASKFLVSNGEFNEFVKAGGYKKRELWDDEGWRWKEYRQAEMPTFWVPNPTSGDPLYRLTFDLIEMPWDWPVDVNYLEARAFCKWKGPNLRVITEAEHHRMRDPVAPCIAGTVEGDVIFKEKTPGNLNLKFGSATPVDMFEPTSMGFHDVHGNVWEWTEDHFHPLPGFRIHPLYDDFSTPCFDNRHNMIMGGAWVSTGDEASSYARFHFRRHFFQNLGFRYVVGEEPVQFGMTNTYESGKSLAEYLLFHYGTRDEIMGKASYGVEFPLDFPVRCAHATIEALKAARGGEADLTDTRVLDLGCAVGRSTFELAREVGKVVGIDFSARFVSAASRLQEHGVEPYPKTEEGLIETPSEARVAPDIDRSRVRFLQGDACNLTPALGTFDAILMANLIDRLHHPLDCIKRLPDFLKPGGVIVMTSPYTWLEEFTPRERWLGGFVGEDGSPVRTFDSLRRELEGLGFQLLRQQDLPMLIREHARKFQFSLSHCSSWVYCHPGDARRGSESSGSDTGGSSGESMTS